MVELKSYIQKPAEWVSAVRGTARCESVNRAEFVLRAYHCKRGTDVGARSELLRELNTIAQRFVEKNSVGAPNYGNFALLGMQASKQLAAIEKAGSAWAKVRKVFGPGSNGLGKTNSIQHHAANSIQGPTSTYNYWLELLDPKHRSWGHMEMASAYFQQWLSDVSTTENFFTWLDRKNLAQDELQVQYLAPDERWKYRCFFGNDKLIYRHPTGMVGKREIPRTRFSTSGLWSAHSGPGFAIWVCSSRGVFYTNTHVVSKFHHSSFLSGARVLAAGEWAVSEGQLIKISHKTGHYKTSPEQLFRAMLILNPMIDMTQTVVMLRGAEPSDKVFVKATDFLKHKGVVASCPKTSDGPLAAESKGVISNPAAANNADNVDDHQYDTYI